MRNTTYRIMVLAALAAACGESDDAADSLSISTARGDAVPLRLTLRYDAEMTVMGGKSNGQKRYLEATAEFDEIEVLEYTAGGSLTIIGRMLSQQIAIGRKASAMQPRVVGLQVPDPARIHEVTLSDERRPAPAPARQPRFDGLYAAPNATEGGGTLYFRFLADGRVRSVVSTGGPQDVAQWIGSGKQGYESTYVVRGSSVQFSMDLAQGTHLEYAGLLNAGALQTAAPDDYPSEFLFHQVEIGDG